MKLSFKERAERLGHSLELLEKGIPVTTFITVKDVDQLKEITNLFIDRENNPNIGAQLFGNVPLTDVQNDRTAAGTLRRVNEFIYGDAELHPADRERIKGAFPMQIQATSESNYTPTGPETFNSPVIPLTFNYGTVTLNQGVYINFYNTVVNGFTMDTLVRNGDNGNSEIGDFNIFGTNGSKGSKGTCTVSGSEPGDKGGNGGNGTAGATGGAGNPGGPGLASCQAIFTINNAITTSTGKPVVFFTRSGTGGSGGNGGTGGNGGNGGKGGNGANCECTGTKGGNGGNGGSGGSGGRGGDAGNGVNCAGDITVMIPSAMASMVTKGSATAPPGNFGQGGAPGGGGAKGTGGDGGKGHGDGTNGTKGATGSQGNPGSASQVSGTPATITINVS
ncbi:hypothetical protein [Chitinophaga sp. LS1]|uniref:hypothetical protein n=1 Tax=Chitinophaga sp. LS1 TaxID=3051176 RepID=UPI002AAC4CA7|nr:hypothetical protein [Chitinophaga sp. LS1]WPV64825.1 hypothetical protein QQL36_23770 [Chitinophaga sp. LS1]